MGDVDWDIREKNGLRMVNHFQERIWQVLYWKSMATTAEIASNNEIH